MPMPNRAGGAPPVVNRPTPTVNTNNRRSKDDGGRFRTFWKWLSYALSHPAGFFVAVIFLGNWVVDILHWFPSWVAFPVTVISALLMVVDLLRKGPDFAAVWIGLLWPSGAKAWSGDWGDGLNHWGKSVRDYISSRADKHLGQASVDAIALTLLGAVLVLRHAVHGDNGPTRRFISWLIARARG